MLLLSLTVSSLGLQRYLHIPSLVVVSSLSAPLTVLPNAEEAVADSVSGVGSAAPTGVDWDLWVSLAAVAISLLSLIFGLRSRRRSNEIQADQRDLQEEYNDLQARIVDIEESREEDRRTDRRKASIEIDCKKGPNMWVFTITNAGPAPAHDLEITYDHGTPVSNGHPFYGTPSPRELKELSPQSMLSFDFKPNDVTPGITSVEVTYADGRKEKQKTMMKIPT